jgi:hypothetical protein
MARTPIAVAVLVMALVGCGYEPAPDRASDPLSPTDQGEVGETLGVIDVFCEEGLGEDVSEDVEVLTRVARKRPHGVYRVSGDDVLADRSFHGDTMIQVLERAAHEFDGCLKGQADHMRHSAELLRSVR